MAPDVHVLVFIFLLDFPMTLKLSKKYKIIHYVNPKLVMKSSLAIIQIQGPNIQQFKSLATFFISVFHFAHKKNNLFKIRVTEALYSYRRNTRPIVIHYYFIILYYQTKFSTFSHSIVIFIT